MPKITVIFPDGKKKEFRKAVSLSSIAPKGVIAAKLDGKVIDLNSRVSKDAAVKLLTFEDPEGKDVFRHSSAHVFAHAIKHLYPKAKNTIGPPVEEGFYYDFDGLSITPEEFAEIEKEMQSIVKKNFPFKRKVLKMQEVKKLFKENQYKLEIAEEAQKAGEQLTAYQDGDFTDLCEGPHVPSTGFIKAVKLTKIAGAYWRGDVKGRQLTRIYGISFPSEEQLNRHFEMLKEVEKRDHRKLGSQLELFSIHEESPGSIFWQPKGMILFNALIDFSRHEQKKRGYQEIKTPLILHKSLWLRSGHWEHFKESMYFTKAENEEFAVKPMNCPGAILMYREKVHSYREFPLRLSEYGLVHRHELSGVLSGLFRVRAFTQDDAHIFVTEGMIKDEVKEVISLIELYYKTFKFEYSVILSTKPAKAMGSEQLWGRAEKALKEALEEKKLSYKLAEGEGAFYGPKIDFNIKDSLGRMWQCATVQLDFQMPERFELKYMAEDGTTAHSPVMIHRAIYGSVEIFLGILIEHYAGKFPLWLSPEQARILTIADRFEKYADEIADKLKEKGIRAFVDSRAESIGKKIREAQLSQVNYILVVGEKEIKSKTVNVRTRDNVVHGEMKAEVLIGRLEKEIRSRE